MVDGSVQKTKENIASVNAGDMVDGKVKNELGLYEVDGNPYCSRAILDTNKKRPGLLSGLFHLYKSYTYASAGASSAGADAAASAAALASSSALAFASASAAAFA